MVSKKLIKKKLPTFARPARDDLLPCPFCGCTKPIFSDRAGFGTHIMCNGSRSVMCRAYMDGMDETEVIEMWNRRAK